MNETSKGSDFLAIGASLFVIVGSVVWVVSNGVLTTPLTQDSKLAWHLVRSSGIVAYGLLLASTIWGLFMSSQFVANWSPGVVSMTLHSTISWLAVGVSFVHAFLLLFDGYFTYRLETLWLPFTGDYRPEWVGLGTIAFWIIVLVSVSFPLKKYLGHHRWQWLHLMSYLAFGLVSLHAIFAGTDSERLGFRLLIGGGILGVVLLLGIRLGKTQAKSQNVAKPTPRNPKPSA